ncbi:hypothetical protein OIU84_009516 [Salix udensis]|uniref:Uncharacterized protein n=1 Tax=Salix udensis TaxID=889485 RepID=A0AAD6JRV3_9ROSI|nr:hypothetical protein OIU84_009516 [Salix udensis]
MILASSGSGQKNDAGEKRFLYDIVANGRNGVDVDKFDYIVRDSRACGLGFNFEFQRLMETMQVMGDEICYPCQGVSHRPEVVCYSCGSLPYSLCSPKSKGYRADDYPSEYWKLDDSIIKTIETAPNQQLREARNLIRRIRTRNLYQFCNEYAVPRDKIENFKNVTARDIVCSQKNGGVLLKEEDVAVSNARIDLTRGMHNPLERIKFFKDYESEENFIIPDDRISHLLPTCFQDKIVRVYAKKPELVGAISEAFENFQFKTYGIKVQVHATPEKKKRRM